MKGLRLGIKKSCFPAIIEGYAIEGIGEKQCLTSNLLADLKKRYTKNQIVLVWLNDKGSPLESV